MASKEIVLSNIVQDEFLSWFATTQAAYSVRMKLYDDSRVYFDSTRRNREIEPPLAQGSRYYTGRNLRVFIDIPESSNLQTFLNTFTLLTPTGMTVGHGFTCCGEDQNDADFNDFYISVMAWQSKG